MPDLTLIIGQKNYSSWSLRPWSLLKQAGIAFREYYLPIGSPQWHSEIAQRSPSGRVPALEHGSIQVWDSLAICEYLAERFPEKQLWPTDTAARAEARSISAEMHAGFQALRQNMFMNIRRSRPGVGRTPETLQDIERITAIWNGCRARFAAGGPFLFGRFSIADAMYAPVALRFRIYADDPGGAAGDYATTLLALPAIQERMAAARTETERLEHFEPADA